MKAGWTVLALLAVPGAFGQYSYYQTDTFPNGSVNTANWNYEAGYNVVVSKLAVPDGSSAYQVISTYTTQVTQYLEASPSSYAPSYPYFNGNRLELHASTAYINGQGWTTGISLYSQYNYGTVTRTLLASVAVGIPGNTLRTVVWPVNGLYSIAVFLNDVLVLQTTAPGSTGPGKPGEAGLNPIYIGLKDKIAPNPVNGATITTSVFPTEIDAQWQAASDDTNGVGIWQYQIYRNGVHWTDVTSTSFADQGASPGTVYNYTIYAVDWHLNKSTGTTFSVTTPGTGPNPAVVTPPARTGVRSTGSYWGAGSEQIDMLSGNLNFTLPLFKAMGRGGWGQTFALSYNSQLWRLDSGGTWNLGKDVGYGYGWRLMAGSIAPYWSDVYTLLYYIFTDSTGAEYKLDTNTNGIWTSSQGIYLTYDGANQLLYFPDGSFWKMGCASAGTEPDAGTRYPTIMQDTNGNQVLLRYQTGAGAAWTNSSARITEIEDVRAVLGGGGTYRSWAFTYNTDATPHLTGITDYIGTPEGYTFAYLTNQSLSSPFQPPVSYPATTMLQTVTNTAQLTHTFEYTGGSGEMSKVTLPRGAALRWAYRSFTYSGKTVREVQYRYLTKATGATETTYTLTRDDVNNPNNPVNAYTCIADPSGIGQKCWFNNTTATSWQMGLTTSIEQRPAAGQNAIWRQNFTWVQDSAGNPYIGTVLSTQDPSGANVQSKTTQTLDTHGNVLTSNIYDYGNLNTAARTYTNSYLTTANYTNIGIWNRLVSTTVTNGTQTVTLVTNTYDAVTPNGVSGLREYVAVGNYRGNVTTSVVPGQTINTTYDASGAVVARNDAQSHTVSLTQAASTNYAPGTITLNSDSNSNQNLSYTPWLAPTSITGPNSTSASVGYDSWARPATSTSVYGAVSTYTYGGWPTQTVVTTNGHWVRTTTDGLGRAVKVERGYSSTTVSTVDTVYDSCACSPVGKMKKVSQPYAPGGTVYWTVYNYDALGRTVSVVLPDGASTTTYAYSGNTTTITDPAGKWKKQTVDVFGNIKQVNEPNPAGGADYVTTYTYDMLNHLTQVSMPRPTGTQTRTFVYDATTQRLMSETQPETGATSYTYNADGTLATKTNARSQMTKYLYDTYQRVTQTQYFPDPAHPTTEDTCARVTWTYDTNTLDATFSQNSWGRPTTATWGANGCVSTNNHTFRYMFSYTSGGLLTKKRVQLDGHNLDATYTYNTEGRVATVQHPSAQSDPGLTYTYTFDSMGRPYSLVDNAGTPYHWVNSTTYGPSDEMQQLASPTSTETRSYNSLVQLTAIGSTVYSYSATQNNGRIVQAVDPSMGTVTYGYDSLNRLASASSSAWGETFTYDGFGNLTDKTPTSGAAPALHVLVTAATNRLSTSSGYGYDATGNLTSGPGFLYATYDVQNHMATYVPTSGGTEYYSYGPDNMRVWKKPPSGPEEVYFYGAQSEKLGRFNYGTGVFTTLRRSIYFGARVVNEGQDRLGSVPDHGGYYPYGEAQTAGFTDQDRFATYYRDGTSGLDYSRNRYYSSAQGRFMSADPYRASGGPADPGSWNRYAYVQGDPVNFNDRSGLDATSVAFGCFIELDGVCDSSFDIGVTFGPITRSRGGYSPPFRDTQMLPGFSDPAYTVLVAPGDHSAYILLSVNWDVIFQFEAATGTWPSTWPQAGLTWERILAALRANPLTAVLALSLVQTGGSGKGAVGSSEGSWYNPITNESLHPDLDHQNPIGPHWDYTDPTGKAWRCFPDGTYKPK